MYKFTCTKISLVEKNISSLEHRIYEETDAAFILHVALHLRKRLRGEKHETKHGLQLRRLLSFPPPPRKEPFSLLRPIDSQANAARMSSHDVFHRV